MTTTTRAIDASDSDRGRPLGRGTAAVSRPRTAPPADGAPVVGENLRRLRSRRGLSLERLSQRCGVSRAVLSQIELGQSAPTINVLWKIARTLEVTFSTLITHVGQHSPAVLLGSAAKLLTNQKGTFTSRALFPFDQPRRTEFYELGLKVGGEEQATPHPPGTVENLVVTAGSVEIGVDQLRYRLNAGDAILFAADVPHHYANVGTGDAVMYLVMSYAADVG